MDQNQLKSEIFWPRITVVTPSFNQGRFLEDTIKSVLNQRYPNLEYMVMDGGSTDGSQAIIEKYVKHLAFWRSCPDQGQAAAINEGFCRSTGEILGWLNSDDLYEPGALFAVAAAYQVHPTARLIWGDCSLATEKGEIFWTKRAGNWTRSKVILGSSLPQPATFITKPVMDEVGAGSPHQISMKQRWSQH